MSQIILPAIWLIVFIVGLPKLSETAYTPSLPDIASSLGVAVAMVEYTLTVYLLGFAFGTLFWGKLSDRIGRKPCILAGLIIFIVGCALCYSAQTIEILMISRVIQAFGGSVGSVLGQALCRDAFSGPALGKVYSATGSALALFPAIGPAIGGIITQSYGWQGVFAFLTVVTAFLAMIVMIKLPETHHKHLRQKVSIPKLLMEMITDRKVLGYGMIVAGCNGISFSYFAEGPFFLMNILGMSAQEYGFSFVLLAIATMLGGIFSKRLHDKFSSRKIMGFGLYIILVASLLFSLAVLIDKHLISLSNFTIIALTLVLQSCIMFGICVATSNALALALVDYRHAIGTASSLFGFCYYAVISLFTLVMGELHNGTLLPMPIYFFVISLVMLWAKRLLLRSRK